MVKWKRRDVHDQALSSQVAYAGREVQVVSERDPISLGHLLNFVLAVAVECSPLYGAVGRLIRARGTPIKDDILSGMPNKQPTAFMVARQRNDKRTKLGVGARRINMSLEEIRRGSVDL